MNSLLMLSISSLFYIFILSCIFFGKEKIKNKETKIYKILIITLLIEIILEVSMRILANYMDSLLIVNQIVAKLFVFASIFWFSLMTIYNAVLSVGKNKSRYQMFKTIIIFVMVVAFVFIMLLPIEFMIYPGNDYYSYTYGTSVDFAYTMFAILMVINVVIILCNPVRFLNLKYLPVILSVILFIVSGVIQNMNPELILNLFSQSLVTFIMYHTIENPDLKLLREIQESKQLSEQANKEKAMFLYDMAQDIRMPIKMIETKCTEMLKETDTNILLDGFKDIKLNTKKLTSTINNVLDTSSIKTSNIEIVNSKYNVKNILHELSSKTKVSLKDKNIDFRSDFDENMPDNLYGDSIRLKQIISILLDNAIKHTEKGFIEFNASSIIKKDVCRLIITIEDSGRGIESRKLDTLFYTADEEIDENKITNTKESLSVVKLLVNLIGGTVIVNSELGKGSKFTIVLDQEIYKEEKSSIMEAVESLPTTKKILLVESDEVVAKNIAKLLSKYEFDLDIVHWGQDCLEKIRRKEKFDLILLDEEMPKLNGIKTFEKLKMENNFDIPVILLIEAHHEDHIKRYINNGFEDVLVKPLTKQNVTKVLERHFNKNS